MDNAEQVHVYANEQMPHPLGGPFWQTTPPCPGRGGVGHFIDTRITQEQAAVLLPILAQIAATPSIPTDATVVVHLQHA